MPSMASHRRPLTAENVGLSCASPDGKTYGYSIQRRLSTLYLVTGLK